MIITVAHTKGGVGKSTLAWNLAHSLLEKNEKVTIVDLDFQQNIALIFRALKTQIRTKVSLLFYPFCSYLSFYTCLYISLDKILSIFLKIKKEKNE